MGAFIPQNFSKCNRAREAQHNNFNWGNWLMVAAVGVNKIHSTAKSIQHPMALLIGFYNKISIYITLHCIIMVQMLLQTLPRVLRPELFEMFGSNIHQKH